MSDRMPPDAAASVPSGTTPGARPAALPYLTVLKHRPDFIRASRALRQAAPGLMLQARERGPDEPAKGIRVGFTCTRKVGNAVARNRAKRRLREIARMTLPMLGRPGWDYVLVGRVDVTARRPFDALRDDLVQALRRIHAR
ncbi:MAG: ribonuclease P protein component [Rhodobacteraceae bacterium]|nr:ribonuclease P protein component [Paracoccaceae bacterium]